MPELAPRIALFCLIASAPGWRGLGWRMAIAALLVAGAFGWVTGWRFSLVVPGGDADIGAGIALYFGTMWLASGLFSRAASLLARRFGHARPGSLWIEVVGFFAVPIAYERLVIGG